LQPFQVIITPIQNKNEYKILQTVLEMVLYKEGKKLTKLLFKKVSIKEWDGSDEKNK